jgi:hypothetical protein
LFIDDGGDKPNDGKYDDDPDCVEAAFQSGLAPCLAIDNGRDDDDDDDDEFNIEEMLSSSVDFLFALSRTPIVLFVQNDGKFILRPHFEYGCTPA